MLDLQRLVPLFALAQIAGILVADGFGLGGEVALAGGVVALGAAAASRRAPALRIAALASCVLCAGAFAMAVQRADAERHRPRRPEPRRLEGTLASIARRPDGFRAELSWVVAVDGGQPLPNRITWLGAKPSASGPPVADAVEGLAVGDRVRLWARVAAPQGLRNPGARGSAKTFARRGVGAVARLLHPSARVRRVSAAEPGIRRRLDARRRTTAARLVAAGPGGGLLAALALGERSGLSDATRDGVSRLGLSHLLAVSGLHLALVGGLAYSTSIALLRRVTRLTARWDLRLPALAIAVVSMAGYAAVSGWGVPVRRSLVVAAAFAGALALGRRTAPLQSLALASLFVLTAAPDALFGAGTQMSFAASGALALAARRQPEGEAGWGAWLRSSFHVSAVAFAWTAPVAAWHLGVVAPTALLANGIAVPWTGFVLLPAALTAAGVAQWPDRAPLGDVAEAALEGLAGLAAASLAVAEGAAPYAPVVAAAPGLSAGWFVLAAALAVGVARSEGTAQKLALASAIPALFVLGGLWPQPTPEARITFLEVGQGDATLIEAGGAAVLVDAGTAWPGGDLGRSAVVPALSALGVERLDLVVVSHLDLDHRGGIPSVLDALPVGEVWVPFAAAAEAGFAGLARRAFASRVPIVEAGAGHAPLRVGALAITPLWPPAAGFRGSANDRSLVVRVEVGSGAEGAVVLLPGDIGVSAEGALLESGAPLSADVLKLAHHGSRTSTGRPWLDAVGPRLAIASSPCWGRFGMPHPEVVARLEAEGVSLWWTGRDGAIRVTVGAELTTTIARRGPPPECGPAPERQALGEGP